MTNLDAYTVWCKGGRVGTYRSREKAEAVLRAIASHPLEFLHIQEWTPGEGHYPFVTFDEEEVRDERENRAM
jgi:hypothetical protein